MRDCDCYYYQYVNDKLKQNRNTACWAGCKDKQGNIYIDKYIEPEITDEIRERIIFLVNKIRPCSFVTIEDKTYIKYKLYKNHYSNLLLLNFIRILWYRNKNFNNDQFFIDILKEKPDELDYLEFMLKCVKDNVDESGSKWSFGDHSFVYKDIKLKTKKMLSYHKGFSMQDFLQK